MRFPFFIGKEQPMAIYQGHNEDSSGNLLLSIGNGMTATVETGSTASQAYTKGSYLFFNNRLCKAASAIAKGATLTIGGNLTQTSLGAEITSHLRSSDGKEFYFDVKNGQYGYYPSASKIASEFVPFGGTSDKFYSIVFNGNLFVMHVKSGSTSGGGSSTTQTVNGVTFTAYSNTSFKASVAGTWFSSADYSQSSSAVIATHANANQQVTVTTGIIALPLAFIAD